MRCLQVLPVPADALDQFVHRGLLGNSLDNYYFTTGREKPPVPPYHSSTIYKGSIKEGVNWEETFVVQ
jgi:hypothetical protein